MKRIKGVIIFLTILLVATTGNVFAEMETSNRAEGQGGGFQIYNDQKGASVNAFMATKILGSTVRNMKGDDLGSIRDIVINPDDGRILYAVMDFGGFLGLVGEKLFPVPWNALLPLPSEGVFYLDVSKEKLKQAPGYARNNLPDMGDLHWGTKVADFYRAPRGEHGYASDYGVGYGYGYGLGLYPSIAQQDPFAGTFDPKSMKSLSGEVIKVETVIPKSGTLSQMQVELIVFADKKEAVPVYLGPMWYVIGPNRRIPFKSGDRVTATGSWITSETEPFMIATAVTKGDRTLRLRKKNGSPVWNAWEKINIEEK